MSEKNHIIKTAPFTELTAVPAAQVTNTTFDIIIEDEITLFNYCSELLDKLLELPQSKIRNFIYYHCDKVKEPGIWLNKLEKLIATNKKLFLQKDSMCRFTKLYSIIEIKRQHIASKAEKDAKPRTPKRLINAEAEDRHFSFHETKSEVEKMKSFKKQKLFLTKEIYEYQLADLHFKSDKLQAYDEQCKKLLEHLKIIQEQQSEIEKEELHNGNKKTNNFHVGEILKVNGPSNIIIYAFKQMMNYKMPDGKTYLDYSIKEISEILGKLIKDETGEFLSIESIKTRLSPNNKLAEPKDEYRVKI